MIKKLDQKTPEAENLTPMKIMQFLDIWSIHELDHSYMRMILPDIIEQAKELPYYRKQFDNLIEVIFGLQLEHDGFKFAL